MLHVTSGACAGERLRAAGVQGTLPPWRDVLHDGPVPAGADAVWLHGIDRWIGGVRLVGRAVPGRWHRRARCTVETGRGW